MKTIILNASPRKNWNTAQLLEEAKKGAEQAGAETEIFNLYNLNFTGCRSCLACKRAGIDEPCKCYWKDEFSPVIDKIYAADRLIIGSPIYYGEPTGVLRQAIERICFPAMSYNTHSSLLNKNMDVAVILTMNVNRDFYEKYYAERIETYFMPFEFLNAKAGIFPVYDTLQVMDYDKYEIKCFSEEHKKTVHAEQFPHDLEMAFQIGKGGQSLA
jgi:multimeric flavodoxin WrbA